MAPEAWISSKAARPPEALPWQAWGGEAGMYGWLGTYTTALTDRREEAAEDAH